MKNIKKIILPLLLGLIAIAWFVILYIHDTKKLSGGDFPVNIQYEQASMLPASVNTPAPQSYTLVTTLPGPIKIYVVKINGVNYVVAQGHTGLAISK